MASLPLSRTCMLPLSQLRGMVVSSLGRRWCHHLFVHPRRSCRGSENTGLLFMRTEAAYFRGACGSVIDDSGFFNIILSGRGTVFQDLKFKKKRSFNGVLVTRDDWLLERIIFRKYIIYYFRRPRLRYFVPWFMIFCSDQFNINRNVIVQIVSSIIFD